VEADVLVSVERGPTLGAVVEGLRGDLRVEVRQGRVQALEEGSGRVHEDALVGGAGEDLRWLVLFL
jgi:hypothetical protein